MGGWGGGGGQLFILQIRIDLLQIGAAIASRGKYYKSVHNKKLFKKRKKYVCTNTVHLPFPISIKFVTHQFFPFCFCISQLQELQYNIISLQYNGFIFIERKPFHTFSVIRQKGES